MLADMCDAATDLAIGKASRGVAPSPALLLSAAVPATRLEGSGP